MTSRRFATGRRWEGYKLKLGGKWAELATLQSSIDIEVNSCGMSQCDKWRGRRGERLSCTARAWRRLRSVSSSVVCTGNSVIPKTTVFAKDFLFIISGHVSFGLIDNFFLSILFKSRQNLPYYMTMFNILKFSGER